MSGPGLKNKAIGRGFVSGQHKFGPGMNQLTRQEIERLDARTRTGQQSTEISVPPWSISTDCLNTTAGLAPWSCPSGTLTQLDALDNRPGIVNLVGAYSRIVTDAKAFKLAGGEESVHLVRPKVIPNGHYFILGFFDNFAGSPTNAAGLYILNTSGVYTISGLCKASGTYVLSASKTITINEWLCLITEVAQNLTSVRFRVLDDAGSEILNEILTANIPTAVMGHGLTASNQATCEIAVDYIGLSMPQPDRIAA